MYSSFPPFSDWVDQANGHEAFDAVAREFSQLRDDIKAKARVKAAREISMETNAIEGIFATDRGFTRTVAEAVEGWETEMESRGNHIRPAFENSLAGYELALDMATGRTAVTQKAIRELHARMTASQDTVRVKTSAGWQKQQLSHGEYKRYPNSPTRPDGTLHHYSPPEDVQAEMSKLVDALTTEKFVDAHPVVQASFIHYAFVAIHPFADGNGRVSRALAGIYLLRDPGIPFVMFNDQRDAYLDALEYADKGIYRPFIDFVEQRTIDALRLAVEQFGSTRPSASELLEGLQLTEDDSDGHRLMDAVFTSIEKKVLALNFPASLDSTVARSMPTEIITICRSSRSGFPVIGVTKLLPGQPLRVTNSDPSKRYEPFRDLVVEKRNIHPVIDESTRQRIEAWTQQFVDHFVGVVVQRYQGTHS